MKKTEKTHPHVNLKHLGRGLACGPFKPQIPTPEPGARLKFPLLPSGPCKRWNRITSLPVWCRPEDKTRNWKKATVVVVRHTWPGCTRVAMWRLLTRAPAPLLQMHFSGQKTCLIFKKGISLFVLLTFQSIRLLLLFFLHSHNADTWVPVMWGRRCSVILAATLGAHLVGLVPRYF